MPLLVVDGSMADLKRSWRQWRHRKRDEYKRMLRRKRRAAQNCDEYMERHRQELETLKGNP